MKKTILCFTLLAGLHMGASAEPMHPAMAATAAVPAVASQPAPSDGEAIDFTLTDLTGKPFTLSSLKGKYVVVDFWGSWCINCIKGFPKMKEYYQKHRGRLEIVSVDCNDSEARWKAAVQKHGMPWVNVYNPRGDGDLTKKLGITAFPTKLLVDPEGKVVKTFVGEDDSFYTVLDATVK